MTILVTGATGNVGRGVVAELLAAGHGVRALTRTPETAGLPAEAEVVRGDLADPGTLTEALAGIERMHLFASGDIDGVVKAAEQAGVRRIVALSSVGVTDAQPDSGPGYHHINELTAERAVRNSTMDWTIVRSTEFMANALAWADSVRSGAPVLVPFATVEGAPVHQADIAAVIVAALLEDGHHRRIHTLTGPELLTPLDQARLIGEAIGRDVLLEEITPARARELWLELGTPAEVADWLLEAGAAAEFTTMLPTVEQITGRPARTFARWAADHAADFR